MKHDEAKRLDDRVKGVITEVFNRTSIGIDFMNSSVICNELGRDDSYCLRLAVFSIPENVPEFENDAELDIWQAWEWRTSPSSKDLSLFYYQLVAIVEGQVIPARQVNKVGHLVG